MARNPRITNAFTVSGPGVDKSYETGPVALSAAITFATTGNRDETFYVRDPNGNVFGYVEKVDKAWHVTRKGGDR